MKVSNKDFLELQCRTVLSDGIKRLLSRTVPLFGFYLWESGSFLLGFHPIGQVLLPPPSKPESSRDLPWSLHQAGFLWDHRAPAASLASVYGALPCCHDALCCGEHKDVSPHPPRGDLQEEGSREEEDQHSSSS
ncbi:iron-sulfur cluster assembly 1 homolog, mitochondrial isoform X2 [Canis lupus familiaris]|uniref:iron-sulfur cluster assembly 1 homolog, mitochondrial isoform X2 n=1 Tax=Canis lupus familiaris TaxID=9615 RepID=UPI0018F5D006|nr:iron-sulfur cluster assembly 1 homolog, mitochondrial isoform X2 [Canis lupus familiaris]XP_038426214.1 iron-sulfur cluster assembly 1 homolog, mitochondrial isoform X2 [Canis lupus familiaris]XP_038510970.1 iron-sulfur cluster assembly 1 homolog, mitochondrial isoform X2 [Canis lupus familiaris]XP_048972041.1 iron-sulfur cluster assembly 1 homolog, mitochondrial isoform X4 [Canis lupus dingo]